MKGQRQLLLIACVGIALVVAAVVLGTRTDKGGHMLVETIFEIAGPPETTEAPKKKLTKARPAAAPIAGLPSASAKDIEAVMDKGAPTSLRAQYAGTWVERSIKGDVVTTLSTTFAMGGTFQTVARARSRDEGRTLEVTTRGRWTVEDGSLVMVVDESDAPELIPVGFVQRHEGSKVRGDDWTYEDGEGAARIARRR